MAITRQEWADWLHAPVTQAVIQRLEERKDVLIGEMLNLDKESLEAYGMYHIAYRNQLEGLGEFLDLHDLRDAIVTEVEA